MGRKLCREIELNRKDIIWERELYVKRTIQRKGIKWRGNYIEKGLYIEKRLKRWRLEKGLKTENI